MNKKDEFSEVKSALDSLRAVSGRSAQAAARGRSRFLAQVAKLQPVSASPNQRHTGWKAIFKKERLLMNVMISIMVGLALMLGGGTATVYAAQDDMPNEPLYGVKLWSEDARLWVNADPQGDLNMLMQFVQTRVQEMAAMAEIGQDAGDVALRLEKQIQQAMQLAAGMDDAAMQGALLQIRTTLQTQEQFLAQSQNAGEASQLMIQAQTMLRERIRIVDEGLVDPQGYRNTVRTEVQIGSSEEESQGNGPGAGDPGTAPGNQDGEGSNSAPADGQGSGNGEGQDGNDAPHGNGSDSGKP